MLHNKYLPTELPWKTMIATYLNRIAITVIIAFINLIVFYFLLVYPLPTIVTIVTFVVLEIIATLFGEEISLRLADKKNIVFKPFANFFKSVVEIKQHGTLASPKYYYYNVGYGAAISTTMTLSLFVIYFAILVVISLLFVYIISTSMLHGK